MVGSCRDLTHTDSLLKEISGVAQQQVFFLCFQHQNNKPCPWHSLRHSQHSSCWTFHFFEVILWSHIPAAYSNHFRSQRRHAELPHWGRPGRPDSNNSKQFNCHRPITSALHQWHHSSFRGLFMYKEFQFSPNDFSQRLSKEWKLTNLVWFTLNSFIRCWILNPSYVNGKCIFSDICLALIILTNISSHTETENLTFVGCEEYFNVKSERVKSHTNSKEKKVPSSAEKTLLLLCNVN